jgi:hypothetical protein
MSRKTPPTALNGLPADFTDAERRRFLRLCGSAAAVLPVTLLTGCGGGDDAPPSSAAKPPPPPAGADTGSTSEPVEEAAQVVADETRDAMD